MNSKYNYQCDDCENDEDRFKTNVYQKLKNHIKQNHKDSKIVLRYKYTCELYINEKLCKYQTDDKSKWKRHLKETKMHGNQPTLQCTLCNKMCYTNHHLNDHMKTHSDEGYICPVCNDVYSTPNSLRNHVRVYHEIGDKIYTCKDCDEEFDAYSRYQYHREKYHKEYICFICNRDCIFNSNLRRHLRTVHQFSAFSCTFPDCTEQFFKKKELNQHVQEIHTPHVKLIFCDKCPFFIDTQERLDSHCYYVHPDGKKTYPCIYCDYIGEHPSRTKRHVQTVHRSEKPFECDMCDATFKLKEILKQHQVIHSNETPFHCDKCIYKAKTQSRLTSHKYCHDPDYKYNCHVCVSVYPRKANLMRHLETAHSPDVIAGVKKQKEYQVYLFLKEKGLDIQGQLTVNLQAIFKDETLFYVDFYFELNGILFLLEIDEEMHTRYGAGCDSTRMHKIFNYMFAIGEERPIIFLRYNPDRFTCDGVKYTYKTYERTTRMEELYEFITTYQTNDPYSVKYFYYDSNDDIPAIAEHLEYDQQVRLYVL